MKVICGGVNGKAESFFRVERLDAILWVVAPSRR